MHGLDEEDESASIVDGSVVVDGFAAAVAESIRSNFSAPPAGVPLLEDTWWRSQAAFLVGSHTLLFASASWFFAKLLYRDYEVKHRYIQLLFATTFAASSSMFALILETLAGVVDRDVRNFAWKVDHWTLILLAYVALPASFVWTSVRSIINGSTRFALVSAVSSLPPFWYAIYISGRLIHIESTNLSSDLLMARIGILGVSVVATISGFGSVNFPFQSMHSFLRAVTQQQVADVEQRLIRTMRMVATKKRQELVLKLEEAKAVQLSEQPVSLLGRMARFVQHPLAALETLGAPTPSAASQRLHVEIEALEGFGRELFIELDELIQARICELKARTLRGRIMNVLGSCCSAICVYKIVMATINLLLRRGGAQAEDPATRLLNVLLVHLMIPIDPSYWVPVLSMVFVGYLTFANTRQFIHRLLSIFRMVSTSVTSNSLALLLSEVMAMYFAACVLLTLRFVPKRDRAEMLNIVGDIDMSYVHLHFDYVFLLSSLCTLAVFSLSYWLKGPAADTHSD